jgi:hypothetical protein
VCGGALPPPHPKTRDERTQVEIRVLDLFYLYNATLQPPLMRENMRIRHHRAGATMSCDAAMKVIN